MSEEDKVILDEIVVFYKKNKRYPERNEPNGEWLHNMRGSKAGYDAEQQKFTKLKLQLGYGFIIPSLWLPPEQEELTQYKGTLIEDNISFPSAEYRDRFIKFSTWSMECFNPEAGFEPYNGDGNIVEQTHHDAQQFHEWQSSIIDRLTDVGWIV